MRKIIIIGLLLLLSARPDVTAQVGTSDSASVNKEYFDVNAATQKYIDELSPEQKAKSDAYYEGGYLILLLDFLIDVLTAWIFLSLGLSKWIKSIASKSKKANIRNLIYIFMYLFLAFLIAFPNTVYTTYFREHRYGLSNMNFSQWLSEEMIQTALVLVFVSFLIMLLYVAIRKTSGKWWIWGSGIVIIFMIVVVFISPVFISPLFNEYTPLENGKIRDEILSLARANSIPVDNVYQFNASKQSTIISANVGGIGSTIRISLNDNLLNKCTPAEIKAVMAHELGHYVLNHTYKLMIYFGIYIFIGFAFINLLMKKAITRYGQKWGIDSISDIGSLPLFAFLFSFFLFITTPVTNNMSRTTESEADIFGLNAAGEPDGFASTTMKLSEYRKIDPSKLEEIIFYDHPSGRARITMAMKWKAEHLNKKSN
jgi:STE24 endopeptidase